MGVSIPLTMSESSWTDLDIRTAPSMAAEGGQVGVVRLAR